MRSVRGLGSRRTLTRLTVVVCCALMALTAAGAKSRERFITDGFDPAVSPDGTRLAFARNSGDNIDIWICQIDGSGARRLTDHPARDASPAWSPDGRTVAFVSKRTGGGDLYLIGVDEPAPPRRLTEAKGPEDDPDDCIEPFTICMLWS